MRPPWDLGFWGLPWEPVFSPPSSLKGSGLQSREGARNGAGQGCGKKCKELAAHFGRGCRTGSVSLCASLHSSTEAPAVRQGRRGGSGQRGISRRTPAEALAPDEPEGKLL